MKQFIFATLAMLALCSNAGATEYHGTFVGNLIPPMTTTLTSSNGSMSFSQSINPVGGVNYDLNVISRGSVNFYGNGSGITNIPLTGLTNNSANSGKVLYITPTGAIDTEISSGVSGVQTNWTNIWTGTNTFTNMVNMTNVNMSGVFTLAPGATFSAPSTYLSVGSISANSGSINGSAIVTASALAATIGAQVQGSNYLTSSSNLVTSNGYFQGVCGATNGFASWSTNQLAPGYAAGWTNLGTVGGITNRMYANVIGTSGSIVYWGRTGANGVTPCGFPIFTNTVSVVGQVIPVGVNCGIQINSGVGVTITPYSQGE